MEDFGHLFDFERFNLLMIEQPLWNDDFYFHARLQKKLKTALCLDESIRHARDATAAIEIGACRIINVKVGRVGGMTEAIKVHDVCQKHDIPVWCGGMLETGVGRVHNVHLSTLANFKLPGDVSASKRYWKEDIIEPEVEVTSDGLINVPDAPGTGYKIKDKLISRLSKRTQMIRI
jgi:O-succinylbenzoate synthase